MKDFARTYGAKWPKAAKEITGDEDGLLAFYDFPAEHWIHLPQPMAIESTFSTVKLRTKVTRGTGSAAAALSLARAITAPNSSNAPRLTPYDHGARLCR